MRKKWDEDKMKISSSALSGLRESELEEWKAPLHGWPRTAVEHQHKLLGLKGIQKYIENPGSSQETGTEAGKSLRSLLNPLKIHQMK